MTSVLYIILRVIFVLAILVGMVVILLGINHFSGQGDDEDTERTEELRREVKQSRKVVGKHSLFYKFINNRK